ncbi:MAG TPA: response regulator [Acidimicrobiales bacterium]|nr:response regulator [Acidimicrobiales bacterium]
MPKVLIAADSKDVRDEVKAVLDGRDFEVVEVPSGQAVRQVAAEQVPDLVVVDLQMGSMGGVATCLDLRLEESAGRLPHIPVLMLLDRRADVFLARRANCDGWVVKPLDPVRLRRAVRQLLAGQTFHDESYKPVSV